MTRKEAIQVLSQRPMIAPSKSNKQKMFEKAIDMAIEALSDERLYTHEEAWRMTDLISRADAIEAIQNAYCKPCKERGDDHNEVRCRACAFDDAIIQIDALPSADAVQGEWIDWLGNGNEWECSVCKCSIESHGSIAYNFCPMCGAKMHKGGDDE